MDPLWLFIALLCGFLARQIMLPPMVGFLVAGFVLHALGAESSSALQTLAELGVTLLLFTIGLKLRLRNLLAPEVWLAGSLHMFLITVLGAGLLLLAAVSGLVWFEHMDWRSASVVAFALSFSSTVFAVKIFEERGEMRTRHGQVSIGILIIQDIIAVIFLTLATGKIPSMWAFLLLALPLARPFLNKLLQCSGHGEVLILFGLFMAIGGGQLFHLVGMKADLGALIFGILLSNQEKTGELARSLLSFKDIFLVGFFLSIGLSGIPQFSDIAIALLIVIVLLPIKSLLYFGMLVMFKLRARTAFLSANGLSNYSEFGLIVAAVGVSAGLITQQWLMIIAVALSISFIVAAVINGKVHALYARYENNFHHYESGQRLPKDLPADLGDAEILIVGMGRVGRGAFVSMREVFGDKVYAIDADTEQVAGHKEKGFHVQVGDAEDADFWHGVNVSKLRLVMLAMPTLDDMKQAVRLIKAEGYTGYIAAVTRFEEDRKVLESEGVDATFNFYTGAGTGFAEHVRQKLKESGQSLIE